MFYTGINLITISNNAREGNRMNNMSIEPKFISTYILSNPTASKLMLIGSLGVIYICSST